MLRFLSFMLVSPSVSVLVWDRRCYDFDVRFVKDRGFLVVVLILADMILGLSAEGSLEYDDCCGGGRHERDADGLNADLRFV